MKTTIRIIDNKRVSMTDSEFQLYGEICKAYDRTNFSGKELFKELFEVDKNGIILLVKPPTSQFSSLECYLFICSIQQNQQLRLMWDKINETEVEMQEIIKKANETIKRLEEKL